MVLKFLGSNASGYLDVWTTDFQPQMDTKSSEAAALVGERLVNVLTSALKLAERCNNSETSQGEFIEIIDDFRRYVHMMNRLMLENWKEFPHGVENDSTILLTSLSLQYPSLSKQDQRDPFPPFIPYENLKIEDKVLGRGNYATVHKAVLNSLPVAVKIFSYVVDEVQWLEEMKVHFILQAADSSHVLKSFGYSKEQEDKNKILILELMDTEMQKLIEDKHLIPLPQLTDMMLQIAKGMRHLHKCDVIHRDLKPLNVLLKKDGQNYLVKIADFGVSKAGFKTQNGNTLNRGTPAYMAPEIRSTSDCWEGFYARNVDVYSFGITCSNMLRIKKHGPFRSIENLVTRSTNIEPSKRPSFAEICEELWIVMEELLTGIPSKHIKDSIYLLNQGHTNQIHLTLEGDPVVGGTLNVHFILPTGYDYCILCWVRRYSDDKVLTIQMDTREIEEASIIVSQYKITVDDLDAKIGFKCSLCNTSSYVEAPTLCRIQE